MGDRARAKWAEKWGQGLMCPFQWGNGSPSKTMSPTSVGLYQMDY